MKLGAQDVLIIDLTFEELSTEDKFVKERQITEGIYHDKDKNGAYNI